MFSETGTMGLRFNPLHIINRVAMKKLGESLTDKELEDMMRQADVDGDGRINYEGNCTILHGPSMLAVMAKIYGVLYKQSSSIAFDETSSYWSALKNF